VVILPAAFPATMAFPDDSSNRCWSRSLLILRQHLSFSSNRLSLVAESFHPPTCSFRAFFYAHCHSLKFLTSNSQVSAMLDIDLVQTTIDSKFCVAIPQPECQILFCICWRWINVRGIVLRLPIAPAMTVLLVQSRSQRNERNMVISKV
jgi:hypothetical protein